MAARAVTVPLGVGDEVHFRVPEGLLDRVARQQPPTGAPLPPPAPGSPLDRAIPPGIRSDADYANRRDVLTADIPSEGTMTARGAALLYAALLGDVDGVDLVSPARRADMAAVRFEGQDEVMGFPSRWAFGFSPQRPGGVPSRPGSTFGMVGMNGSAAYADIDTGVAVAVMRSHFDTDLAAVREIDRIVADLGTPARCNVTLGERRAMDEPITELDERFSDPGTQATPWATAREVLETAQLSWVMMVRVDGRPHVTPLVAVWLDDAVHSTTGPGEQKAANLAGNPHVVITTGCNSWDQGLDVIVEGEAKRVTDRATLERLAAAWATKWDGQWRFGVVDGGFAHPDAEGDGPVLVFAVKPTKVLAFGKGPFSQTRYRPS